MDGSYFNNTRKGNIRGIIKNTQEDWIMGYLGNTLETNNIKFELLALVHGLQLAKRNHLIPLEINMDYIDVVTLIKSEKSKYSNILSNCKDLLHQLGNPLIKHVY